MKKSRPIQYELIFIMRVSIIKCLIILTVNSFVSAGELHGQEILSRKVSLHSHNAEIRKILMEIERQALVKFNYSNLIPTKKRVTITVDSTEIREVINQLFEAQVIPQIVGEEIILKPISENDYGLDYLVGPSGENSPFNITVTGYIRDETQQGLPGVNVVEKGTTNGTTTDVEGRFSLVVAGGSSVLAISFIGYTPQEITVGSQTQFSISLKPDVMSLDEIVIVGYGEQKKATVTGSIASVTTKDLVQTPVANISNSLVGRMPGLFAVQGNGEPGNDQSQLRIRGVSTFAGGADPLIMVDGIEVNNYNNLDPNEIENITILKDASSTAIYGVRGANGVLLITTKRGKVGPPSLSFTANVGVTEFTALRKGMNSYDYATSFNQARRNDAYAANSVYVPKFSDEAIEKYRTGEDPIFFPDTDWYDLTLRSQTLQSQYNLNLSGGADRVQYFVSAGYFNQGGLFNNTTNIDVYDANTSYDRYNFRSNFNFDITKRFRARVDLSSQNENINGFNSSTNNANRQIENIARANPTTSPGIIDNKIVNLLGVGLATNPIQGMYAEGRATRYRSYMQGSLRFDHDLDFITKGLSTHVIFNYQNNTDDRQVNRRGGTYVVYNAIKSTEGETLLVPTGDEQPFNFTRSGTRNRREYAEFGFDYKQSFGGHAVTGMVNYNQTKRIDPTLAFGIPNGYQGVVGRVTYNYKEKYLAEYTFGYNGTENFAEGNRFGYFPAYSAGWVVSEESFFPKSDVVSFVKIRGSYGEVGNDRVGNFNDQATRFLYRPSTYTIIPSSTAASPNNNGYFFGEVGNNTAYNVAREGKIGNPDLTWERSIKQNLGIELRFWNDKIAITADVFNEKRSNILWNLGTVPDVIGANLPTYNLGEMENKGFDGDVTYNDNVGNFNFWVRGNYTFARNKILFQDEATRPFTYQNRTGQRFGQNFGLISEGFYNTWEEVNDASRPVSIWNANRLQPGDIKYRDVNGDGRINLDDQVPIGYSDFPEIIFGISVGGSYKGFDFSILFQGADNVSLAYSRRQYSGFFEDSGAVDYLLTSWTQERYEQGLEINFPRFTEVNTNQHNYQASTFLVQDGSYVRLKNAEIGYSFNSSLLNKVGLQGTRVFVNANNLYTWSKVFKGIDPENTPGITNEEPYPLTRTVNFGVSVKL